MLELPNVIKQNMCDYQESTECLVDRDGFRLLRTRVPGEGTTFYSIEFNFSDEYMGHSIAERHAAVIAQLHVLENEVAKLAFRLW